jgi:chemotaxis protein MotA
MDILTFVGLFMGVAAVWYTMQTGHILGLLWDFPSFVLVLGGTLASTFMTYPWEVMKRVPKTLWFMFFPKRRTPAPVMIERMCALAETAISRGVDALPEQMNEDDDEFLVNAVKMLINDWDVQEIQGALEKEMESMLERHVQIQKVFVSMGGYAPVYGLLGTLVGVLGVLRYLGDPGEMGKAMTVAIVTTFYGIFLANFVALPTAGKLETFSSHELLTRQIIMHGILCIKKEMYPFAIREQLEKFVAQSGRKEG